MGSASSKRNIVADKFSEDDLASYNLINIHAPTANLGVMVICGLVGVLGIVIYCFTYTACQWSSGN